MVAIYGIVKLWSHPKSNFSKLCQCIILQVSWDITNYIERWQKDLWENFIYRFSRQLKRSRSYWPKKQTKTYVTQKISKTKHCCSICTNKLLFFLLTDTNLKKRNKEKMIAVDRCFQFHSIPRHSTYMHVLNYIQYVQVKLPTCCDNISVCHS